MKNFSHSLLSRLLLLCFLLVLSSSDALAQLEANESTEQSEAQGTIISRSGQIVSIECGSGELPPVGVRSDMSKYFEEKWGKSVMSGWLGTGLVETVSIEARPNGIILLKVRIIEEKSSITVNDEKVDHFKKGKRVKLSW